jgi:hypothetical protein
MVAGSREPNVLVAGKRFHRDVQAAYVAGLLGVEPARAVEQTIERHSGKRLRADILLIVATEPETSQSDQPDPRSQPGRCAGPGLGRAAEGSPPCRTKLGRPSTAVAALPSPSGEAHNYPPRTSGNLHAIVESDQDGQTS